MVCTCTVGKSTGKGDTRNVIYVRKKTNTRKYQKKIEVLDVSGIRV